MFSLNMLVNTAEGDTYTISEVSGWMMEAGLSDVNVIETPGNTTWIVAAKSP